MYFVTFHFCIYFTYFKIEMKNEIYLVMTGLTPPSLLHEILEYS